MSETDLRYMKMALGLGARGLGRVWPNPAVGCVIVKEDRVVGRGCTADGGRPHAEVVALAQAGELAKGATVYVTLEPCSHHGKSSPCADALVKAGVARVVIAALDKNPEVDGKGIEILQKNGISVTTSVLEEQAKESHKGFFQTVTMGRPFLTLKLAATLDGRIATASGESQWITGPEARRAVHAMRMKYDAVLVGAGTARADDPTLTVRDMGADRQPVRVIASRKLNLPLPSRLSKSIVDAPLWIMHGSTVGNEAVGRWHEVGAETIEVNAKGSQLDPQSLMRALGDKGLTRVFCEGGGALAASLLGANCVDEVVMFSAGKVLGAEGWPAVGALGVDLLGDAPSMHLADVQQVGADIMHRWVRA